MSRVIERRALLAIAGAAVALPARAQKVPRIGILFAGLLMSLLYLSGDTAQMALGLPSSVTGLFQGTLLFLLLAIDVLIHYRLRNVNALHAPAAAPPRMVAETAP